MKNNAGPMRSARAASVHGGAFPARPHVSLSRRHAEEPRSADLLARPAQVCRRCAASRSMRGTARPPALAARASRALSPPRERAAQWFSADEGVRGRARDCFRSGPSPITVRCTSVLPSPARGEGTITTTALAASASARRGRSSYSHLTMSNSAVSFLPRRVAAPGFCFPVRTRPGIEGRAERRQAHTFVDRASRARPAALCEARRTS